MDKKQVLVSFGVRIDCSKKMELSDREIQILVDYKNGKLELSGNEDAICDIFDNSSLSSINGLVGYDPGSIQIRDIMHIDEPKKSECIDEHIVPVRKVNGKILMYEQDLPKMTDEEYIKWFNLSELVDGVRMGPIFPSNLSR